MGSLEGDDELRARLSSFGHDLGMAFQIADDLLDYTGSEDVTGKPSAHDLRERKVTLPLMGAMKRASDDQMQVIRDLFTTVDPSEGAIQDVVQLVHELGGLQYASEHADRYAGRALEALDGLPESPALGALCDSVAYVVGRSS
jgi:octaprenyl-diphosphate synthase